LEEPIVLDTESTILVILLEQSDITRHGTERTLSKTQLSRSILQQTITQTQPILQTQQQLSQLLQIIQMPRHQ